MIPIILLSLVISLHGDPLAHRWVKVVSTETNKVVKEGATDEFGAVEWEFENTSDRKDLVVLVGVATDEYIGLELLEVPENEEKLSLDINTEAYVPITFVFESQEIGELSWFGIDIVSIKGMPQKYYQYFDRQHMFELHNVIAQNDTVTVFFQPGVYQFRGAPALLNTTPMSDPKPNYQIVSLKDVDTGENLENIGDHKFLIDVNGPATYFAKSELRPGEAGKKKKCRLFKKKSRANQP